MVHFSFLNVPLCLLILCLSYIPKGIVALDSDLVRFWAIPRLLFTVSVWFVMSLIVFLMFLNPTFSVIVAVCF